MDNTLSICYHFRDDQYVCFEIRMMSDHSIQPGNDPNLVFTFGLRKGERFPLHGKTIIIGRDTSVDIQLDSLYVSRQHAEITLDGSYWFVIDLHSKNGVYQNLTRIEPGKRVILNDQDQIQIGSVSTFEFHDPEATVHQAEKRMLVLGLWLDEPNRDVFVFNKRLTPVLSPQQFTLLSALVGKSGDVITNDEIAEVLWPGAAGGVESAAIDNAISRLRDRLNELDEAHEYIETLRGVGRRFVQHKPMS